MKKIIVLLIVILTPMLMNGQSYSALWDQVADAEKDDLPKSELQALKKIIKKAEKEKEYGQLLKAEMQAARTETVISPDSLKPTVEQLAVRAENTLDEVVRAIYYCALGYIYSNNSQLDDNHKKIGTDYFTKALAAPDQLAAVKATDYQPFVTKGRDSYIYNDDLLSVICYEAKRYDVLYNYYQRIGENRCGLMMASLELLRQKRPEEMEKLDKSPYIKSLDSLIAIYGDLTECGEIAVERYYFMSSKTDATAEQLWQYINTALERWGSWKSTNALRNAQQELTKQQYRAELEKSVSIPGKEQKIKLTSLRGVDNVTMRVYKVKAQGNFNYYDSPENYKIIKDLLEPTDITVTRSFTGKKVYELFEDSMMLQGLPAGVYMLEFESLPATSISRELYYVSNIRTLVQPLPEDKTRYVVVNATTGQPVKDAKVNMLEGWNNEKIVLTLTTNDKGEVIHTERDSRYSRRIFTTTADDPYCPPMYGNGSFSYRSSDRVVHNVAIYTDRAIYRPGQTIHVGAILYETRDGYINEVERQKAVRVALRDANYKLVEEKKITTDEMGTCAADFNLPTQVLSGHFTVVVNGNSTGIRVEEYKRPTFEVEFPEVNQNYEDGDTVTVKATARSYAGVPVQGATVKYKVERRRAYWWHYYSSYWNQGAIGVSSEDELMAEGEAVTANDGTFTVEMPMIIPKTRYPMFYNFVVTADVTDQGGETHQGQMSLPLGNRKTAFSTTLPEKVLAEGKQQATFNLRNAAGIDITADVKYQIDNGAWQKTKTCKAFAVLNNPLKSGKHKLTAICGKDTLEQDFVVFSLNDKRPAVETDDWFYITDRQFPNDGKPVTYQVGSSDKDVHMVYAIIAGNKILECGDVDKSNELVNRKLTYKEEYGNGLLLSYAWVKNGLIYHHETTIKRPTPDKKMTLQWQTFRNRLTPGQKEEWTLTIADPDGKPAKAQLMAALYDKSLDQLVSHDWRLMPYEYLPQPSTRWIYSSWGGLTLSGYKYVSRMGVPSLSFNTFDHDIYPSYDFALQMMFKNIQVYEEAPMVMRSAAVGSAPGLNVTMDKAATEGSDSIEEEMEAEDNEATEESKGKDTEVQARENLQETAFFYPQLMADSTGRIAMKFTLPESLTTWRFLGVSHTEDMMFGTLTGEAVASKDVMIQPNIPRFVRMGDEATIAARIFNTSGEAVSGTARLQLLDPETEKVVIDEKKNVTIEANSTGSVSFKVKGDDLRNYSLMIAKVSISSKTFSDGEQHYLPILPDRERVTVTVPFTQIAAGTKTIDLSSLVPVDDPQGKLTFEYTNNPAWLMIQALPSVAHVYDDCAICQATSFYANAIGRHIIKQNPNAKHVFEAWNRETGTEASLMTSLQKNQELKDLVLNETPWVADADRENEQKKRLADFFDENLMQSRLNQAVEKLKKLQLSDGSWCWWPNMPGSYYMTMEVCEMLVRLNQMAGEQPETKKMVSRAFDFMGNYIVYLVKEMKKDEKKGHKQQFPSHKALQWLYVCTIDGRELPSDVRSANNYLKNLLKKETKRLSIFDKAMAAIILNDKTAIKSLKEYTVYKEEMGRYYDTGRALYSWFDYRIPTHVAALEAIQRMTPNDSVFISDMKRWLLQSKRTQAWDTPINSVDAIYAFLNDCSETLAPHPQTALRVNGNPLPTPEATAGLGYVKTVIPTQDAKTFEAEKTSTGTSWGAVYAQFMQATTDITDQQSGIKVKREILLNYQNNQSTQSNQNALKVGDRITVRITIEADRDYDFVQVVDKRAACMEPVKQLSGYQWREGYYCTPKDFATNYYFDMLSKGKHVIETEYYIDREGTYETGTCTAQCAYSPEFRGTTKSITLKVEPNK